MKLKSLLFIAVLSITFFSCGGDDDNSSEEDFDHAAQALIDDAELLEYFATHYLNEEDNTLRTITGDETPLTNQVSVQEVLDNDVNYKLYYLQLEQGAGTRTGHKLDSVLVDYSGILLDSTQFDSGSSNIWFDLTNILYGGGAEGFSYGIQNFKEGEIVVNTDESFDFVNNGSGYIFIPSGLGYENTAQGIIAENSSLIFKITLKFIKETDDDLDGVLTKNEDNNGEDEIVDVDTDEDGIPNYLDDDDDGDGILTKDELGDENNNNIPDYLEAS